MSETQINEETLRKAGIDPKRTLGILDRVNRGEASKEPEKISEIPDTRDESIVDMTERDSWELDISAAKQAFAEHRIPDDLFTLLERKGNSLIASRDALDRIGLFLLPKLSYGVLNGGSATSYADRTKNESFDREVFSLYRDLFDSIAPELRGMPKGITSAFYASDGKAGPSFLELKMRSLLLATKRRNRELGESGKGLFPMFQMTSVHNNEEIEKAYSAYRESEYLKPLIEETGIDITDVETGVQPMIGALTHSEEGEPRELFSRAYGEEGRLLPLPGGHGQCFSVLSDVFTRLYESGKRFIQFGNVDNLGNTVNTVSLALLALSGHVAGFDFAYRTAVDVKGGILVRNTAGHLTCVDIGPAISKDEVFTAEKQGKKILFNCATGLFDLSYLVEHIDRISKSLPVRLSDQDKDAGRYSQAEQITWEVIGMLPDPIIFAVNKSERFLAVKLLIENFLTSGIRLDDARFPVRSNPVENILPVAEMLHSGLESHLRTTYGLVRKADQWVPAAPAQVDNGPS